MQVLDVFMLTKGCSCVNISSIGTSEIDVFKTSIDGHIVKFIDTPGFDDSRRLNENGRSDTDILVDIGVHLERAYAAEIHLTGVIYLQRITDNRMTGSAVRGLRLLKTLCGPENFGNVVLVTTMWDEITVERGAEREAGLREGDNWWKSLFMQGATIRRHHRTKKSAHDIVRHLLKKTPIVLQLQRELAQQHGILAKTTAGEGFIMYLAEKKTEYERRMTKLQDEINALQEDQKAKELKERRKAVEARKRLEEELVKKILEHQKTIEERKKLEEEKEQELKEANEERKKPEEEKEQAMKETKEESKKREEELAEQLRQATEERKRLERETARQFRELQESREERKDFDKELKELRYLLNGTEEDIQKLNKSVLAMGDGAERLKKQPERGSAQGRWPCPVQ